MNLKGRTEMSLQNQARQMFLDLLDVPGLLSPDTLLTVLGCNLREYAGFSGRFRDIDDFFQLTDRQAEIAIRLMPHQIDPIDPGIPLRPPAGPLG